MNVYGKVSLALAGIVISGMALSGTAQASTIKYDFVPFEEPDGSKDYAGVYGFADNWGTTYDEDQRLWFTPDNDIASTSKTGNPFEVSIRAREGIPNSDGVGQVRYNRAGLAVKSSVGQDQSAGVVDGLGDDNESLILNWSRRIRLVSATFNRAGSDERFFVQVSEDGDRKWQSNLDTPPSGTPFDFSAVASESELTGNQLRFWALGDDDSWTLAGVEVEAVPEPASLLGLVAIGGIGSLTLRRKQVA